MHDPTTGRPSSSRTPTAEARPRTPTTTSSPRPTRPSFGDYHADDVVSRKDAAALIGVSPRTTEDWARDGKGPSFRKLGAGRSARIVYRVGDLLAWLESHTRVSTTSGPEGA